MTKSRGFDVAAKISEERKRVQDLIMSVIISDLPDTDDLKFQFAKWQKYKDADTTQDKLVNSLKRNTNSALDDIKEKATQALATVESYKRNDLLIKALQEIKRNPAVSASQQKQLDYKIKALEKQRYKDGAAIHKNNDALNKMRNKLVVDYVKSEDMSPDSRATVMLNYILEMLQNAQSRDTRNNVVFKDIRAEAQKIEMALRGYNEHIKNILEARKRENGIPPSAGVINDGLKVIIENMKTLLGNSTEFGYIIKNAIQAREAFEKALKKQLSQNEKNLKAVKKSMQAPIPKGDMVGQVTWEFRKMANLADGAGQMKKLLLERQKMSKSASEIHVIREAANLWEKIAADFKSLKGLDGFPRHLDRETYLQKLEAHLKTIDNHLEAVERDPRLKDQRVYFETIKDQIQPLIKDLKAKADNSPIVMPNNFKEILDNPATARNKGPEQLSRSKNVYDPKKMHADWLQARSAQKRVGALLDKFEASSGLVGDKNRSELKDALRKIIKEDVDLLAGARQKKFLSPDDLEKHEKLFDLLNHINGAFRLSVVASNSDKKGMLGKIRDVFVFTPPTTEYSEEKMLNQLKVNLKDRAKEIVAIVDRIQKNIQSGVTHDTAISQQPAPSSSGTYVPIPAGINGSAQPPRADSTQPIPTQVAPAKLELPPQPPLQRTTTVMGGIQSDDKLAQPSSERKNFSATFFQPASSQAITARQIQKEIDDFKNAIDFAGSQPPESPARKDALAKAEAICNKLNSRDSNLYSPAQNKTYNEAMSKWEELDPKRFIQTPGQGK